MTAITRRHLIAGMGAVGLAAALSQTFTPGAHAAPTLSDAELEALRDRWVDLITGRDRIVDGDPAFVAALGNLDTQVSTAWQLLEPSPDRMAVFTDADFSDSAHVVTTYTRLASFAIAWVTPGAARYQDEELLSATITGLQDAHLLIYNDGQEEFGNWWSWEIGASRALADTIAILRDHIDQVDLDAYCDAIDHFVPDPWYQFPDSRGKQLSEGANRVDLCQAVIIRSIVGADTDRLSHAVDGLTAVWQYVTEGNGFFRDGSFIQHSTIGYTGTYGLVLLGGLSKLFALLAGTSHDVTDPSRGILTDAVEGSFAPLMFQGQMMDAVRGRAVSRQQERSIDDGDTLIEAVLRLAAAVDDATANRWRGLCRQWIDNNDHGAILDGASIVRTALVADLLSSDVAARPDTSGPRFFPAMDRLVHRGNGWALTVAMCSNRITWYECGNGENNTACQTSQGMTYLYLPGDDGHYDDDFWPTMDISAPAGTTVDTTSLPPRVEGEWGAKTPANDWTGGTVLDEMALIGQHLIGPGGTGLRARKSWWCLDNFVLALGSDIHTGTTAEVKTVVEQRNLGSSAHELLVDGTAVQGEQVVQNPQWAHLEDVGGYVFLEATQVRASVAERQGSWRDLNTGGSEETLSRTYATLEALHPAAGDHYAYLLLPGADITRAEETSQQSPVTVLANTAEVQAARIEQSTAINFWSAATAGGWSSTSPASLLARQQRNTIKIAVSDPTQQADLIELTLADTPYRGVEGSDRVSLSQVGRSLVIRVDVSDLGGVPVEFQIVR